MWLSCALAREGEWEEGNSKAEAVVLPGELGHDWFIERISIQLLHNCV